MRKLILIIVIAATVGLSPIILRLLGLIDGNLSCDFISQILPLTIEAKKMIASGVPMWSWNSFLGDNFVGSNGFYVLWSPFTLLCSLFPYDYIELGIILSLILQVVLCGVTSMAYLRRMGFNDELARLGALMYAFSSFCIIAVYYFNLILFPLILLGVEDLLRRERYAGLKLASIVAIAIICNFYFAVMSLLGASIYFVVRLLYSSCERKVIVFVKGVGSILLGICISSILLIPTILCTAGSERNVTGGIETGVMQVLTGALIKLVYVIVPRFSEGFVELYHPFANYTLYLPFVSCVFVLAYVYRKKNNWLASLLGCYLLILFTPLNAIFSMGASAAYARWCYIILLMMIVATLYSLQDIEGHKKMVRRLCLALASFTIALVLLLRYKLGCFENHTLASLALWEVVMFLVGMIALYIVVGTKRIVRNISAGVIIFGAGNMLIYSLLIVNRSEVTDVDNLISNKCEREVDDMFRYRTDASCEEHNLSYVLNRAIPRQFHSVQNKAMSDFNGLYRSPMNPFISISHHRESFDALASVKEIIVYKWDEFPFTSQKVLRETEAYTVYENDHYIPMGMAYDSFISETDFKRQLGAIDYNSPEKNKDAGVGMLQALVVADDDVPQFKNCLREATAINFEASLDSVTSCRRMNTAVDFMGNTKGFKATVNNASNSPMVYFFSVPNDPGFTAWMDNNTQLPIYRANLGMMAVIVPPGTHALDFRYLTPGLKLGAWLSLAGLIIAIVIFINEYTRDKLRALKR